MGLQCVHQFMSAMSFAHQKKSQSALVKLGAGLYSGESYSEREETVFEADLMYKYYVIYCFADGVTPSQSVLPNENVTIPTVVEPEETTPTWVIPILIGMVTGTVIPTWVVPTLIGMPQAQSYPPG